MYTKSSSTIVFPIASCGHYGSARKEAHRKVLFVFYYYFRLFSFLIESLSLDAYTVRHYTLLAGKSQTV